MSSHSSFIYYFYPLLHLIKPNYIVMLVYKSKQHSKQYTGLKLAIYIEMTD